MQSIPSLYNLMSFQIRTIVYHYLLFANEILLHPLHSISSAMSK